MARRVITLISWSTAGAAVAVVISVMTLLLPPGLGGYNAWNDPHLVVYNLAAILTRIVVFALLGATLAGAWNHTRRPKH